MTDQTIKTLNDQLKAIQNAQARHERGNPLCACARCQTNRWQLRQLEHTTFNPQAKQNVARQI